MATSWFIKSKPRPRSRLMTATENRYESLLRFNLRHRWLTPVISIAVLASAVFPFMKVDKNFDTNETEMFVAVRYEFSEEPSLEMKENFVNQVEGVLAPHRDELLARAIYSFWSDGWTMTRIYLKEGEANEDNIARVRARLGALLPEIAGLNLEVMENRQFWRQDRGKRIAFQIVGEDSELLSTLAEEAKLRLESIPGLIEPFASSQEGGQELHVMLDRELVSRLGVTPTQPAETVGLTFRGRRLQRFRTLDGEREMRLTLDEKKTESVAQLRNLPIWTSAGEKVPLASLAEFREVPGAEHINRDNRLTSVWVGARYEEGTRQDYMGPVTEVAEGLGLPYGYSWTFGSWEERQKEKTQEFVTNLLLALMLIFAVMAGLFESVRQAIALMIALPFAVSGAAWTLWMTGTDFDQPGAVGLLLLIGIVVNNGIVMIEHINSYRRSGMDRESAMVRGGRERLRPILMTAMTTLLSLIPMVVQKPSLGGVYYYSMALVIMGGLFVSTFLTSVLLPTSATLIEDSFGWLRDVLLRALRLLRPRTRPRAAEGAE
jgi:HAE1 family hydrophobic/amphiphilic exporter-1